MQAATHSFRIGLLIASLIGGSMLCAQTPEAVRRENGVYTLHENTHLVLLDVSVTDKQGNPVTGLTQNDFKILEDGQPQSIKFFEEHAPVDPAEVARQRAVALAAQPLNTFTSYDPFSGRPVTVLLLNELFPPAMSEPVLQGMAQVVLRSPPDTPFAVYVLDPELRLVQPVTTDRTLLTTKILQIEVRPPLIAHGDRLLDPATDEPIPLNDVIAARRGFMTGAMQQLAATFKSTPDRKQLFVFTNAFQCSVVESKGTAGVAPCPKYGHVGHDKEFLCGLEDTLEQSRLWIYRYYGGNHIAYGFGCGSTGAGIKDLAHYFTLYYSPTNQDWSGKYRTTTVVPANTSLRLAYRKGYYGTPENAAIHYFTPQAPAPAPAAPNPGEPTVVAVATPITGDTSSPGTAKTAAGPGAQTLHRRVETAAARTLPNPASSVFTVQVLPAEVSPVLASAMKSGDKSKQESQLLTLLFTIPAGESKVVPSDSGQYVARLEISAAGYADGKSTGSYACQVVAHYDGAADPRISKSSIAASLTVKAPGPARSRWIEVTVRDVATGKMGSLNIPMNQVKLPDTQ
jgi:VWFA-related protein